MARKKSPTRKEEISKAAIKVISNIGFDRCSTDKIADAAGISVGTIYNYFDNKKDILSYIFEVEKNRLEGYFNDLMEKDLPIEEKLKIFLKEYFKRMKENQRKAKLLHDESNRTAKGISEKIYNYIIFIRNCFKDLLKEGIEEDKVREDIDLDMMASMIIGSANSLALLGHLDEKGIDNVCQEAPTNIHKILKNGIFKD